MTTEILPYQRLRGMGKNYQRTKVKHDFKSLLTKNHSILLPLAFMLGRASLVGGLMPFGTVLYASTLGINANRVLVAVFIMLGMITGGAKEQVYITLASMLLFNAINIPFKSSKSKLTFRHAVIGFISVIIPEMVTVYLQGFLLYDFLRALFHGFIVFTLIFIFRNAMPVLNLKKGHIINNEEMISIAIVAALAISGLADLQVLGIAFKNVICILVILAFSYKCGPGVGSAVGVTVGLIVSMSTTSSPLIIASYAFCGLLSGVLRQLGKVGSCLGFVLGNAILTIYLNGSVEVLIYLKEIILAIFVFMLVPQKTIEKLAAIIDTSMEVHPDKKSYSLRIKEITVEKLNKFSRAFKELAKTFSEISETSVVANKQDISSLFDRVADKVCKDCSLCMHCWDRNFYNTYQVMFKVVEKLDSKGRIEGSDIPEYFLERCERIEDFVKSINNVYELFKVDMVWKNKIGESRGLVSQQLDGLSKVISDLATEINVDVHFKGEVEDTLVMELNRAGVKVNEAIVYENKCGKYEISISVKGCGGKRSCVTTIEKRTSEIVGRKMVKESNDCYQDYKSGLCTLKLVEEEAFKVTTGVAKASKNNGMVSGDNYTFMNTDEGKYVVALSDGMGSGQSAATQSKATISLLEQLMESGFDKDTTVKLINSILVLKSSEDSFATIDLSVVDLYNGEVEFVKIGTVPTFIKRPQKVDIIKSASLPAGILSNIEMEIVHKKVDSGDFLIMITDGILDSFKKESDDEKEFQSFLQEIKSANPQEIADIILDKAYKNCDGKPVDDMMVVVSKVWKRVS